MRWRRSTRRDSTRFNLGGRDPGAAVNPCAAHMNRGPPSAARWRPRASRPTSDAIEVQTGLIDRNAGVQPERRIEFRVGIHLGDIVEEEDGDLMGDGVNIASRIEGIAKPGAIGLSEDAYRQVKGRLDVAVIDLGSTQLKNIADPIRVYSLEVGKLKPS